MGKIRCSGYTLLSWKGDHAPRHVHVYRAGRLVVKWDLDNDQAMSGKAPRKVRDIIRRLQTEGRL